jgi:hypothetical protein
MTLTFPDCARPIAIMRLLAAFAVICFAAPLSAQQPTASIPTQAEIYQALTGKWVGVLEYRDYQSDGRVKLPTWLEISPTADGKSLAFAYTYDDGPTKTVRESEIVTIDPTTATWTVQDIQTAPGKAAAEKNSYTIQGLSQLKAAHGKLTLLGPGTDNDKKVDVQENVLLGRNIFQMERTVRAPQEKDFLFRHIFVFTREQPPATK